MNLARRRQVYPDGYTALRHPPVLPTSTCSPASWYQKKYMPQPSMELRSSRMHVCGRLAGNHVNPAYHGTCINYPGLRLHPQSRLHSDVVRNFKICSANIFLKQVKGNLTKTWRRYTNFKKGTPSFLQFWATKRQSNSVLEVWEHGHSGATDRRGMAMGCLRAPDTPREALRWRGGQQNQRGRHTRLVGRGHRVARKRGGLAATPGLRSSLSFIVK
eukprot:SAG31_NODE_3058_length_4735_cov_24.146894_3_plen_216_part_00